jgi:oligopeptide/dipeptide ABC transporter ATP-binding protein
VRSAPDVDRVRSSLVAIPGSPPSLINPPSGCRFHPRCKFAEEDCLVTEPPLRLVSIGHDTACLHHERCVDALRADADGEEPAGGTGTSSTAAGGPHAEEAGR